MWTNSKSVDWTSPDVPLWYYFIYKFCLKTNGRKAAKDIGQKPHMKYITYKNPAFSTMNTTPKEQYHSHWNGEREEWVIPSSGGQNSKTDQSHQQMLQSMHYIFLFFFCFPLTLCFNESSSMVSLNCNSNKYNSIFTFSFLNLLHTSIMLHRQLLEWSRPSRKDHCLLLRSLRVYRMIPWSASYNRQPWRKNILQQSNPQVKWK